MRHLRVFLCHSSNDTLLALRKPAVRELYQKLRAESWISPWPVNSICPRRVVSALERALEQMDRNVNPRLLAKVLLLDWTKMGNWYSKYQRG